MKKWSLWIWCLILMMSACTVQPSATATLSSSPTLTGLPSPTPTVAQIQPSSTQTTSATPLPKVVFEKGPYLVPGADSSMMNILWQDTNAADYWVDYGTDTAYSLGKIQPSSITDDGLAQARLENLQPGTRYEYRVTNGSVEADGSFVTPSETSSTLTFWVYGDSRSGADIQNTIDADILADISSEPADQSFLLFSGDIMDMADAGDFQANQFDPQYPSIRQMMSELPMINAMGNHDGTKLFLKYFPYPFKGNFYWSFDYGPVHVAVVDQYADVSLYSEQWTWLKADLAASTQPWKFILLHEPGYSAGPHADNEVVQKIIQNIAYHQGVAVVFAGHNHYYARAEVDGVYHITTAGGGAPLYDPLPGSPYVQLAVKAFHYLKVVIDGSKMTITALTPENKIIDQFSVQH